MSLQIQLSDDSESYTNIVVKKTITKHLQHLSEEDLEFFDTKPTFSFSANPREKEKELSLEECRKALYKAIDDMLERINTTPLKGKEKPKIFTPSRTQDSFYLGNSSSSSYNPPNTKNSFFDVYSNTTDKQFKQAEIPKNTGRCG